MHNGNRKIAIIGGGPGGLTLARILATRGMSATVFEGEAHALARPQGGSLDIHGDSGQVALREAGLLAEFQALARFDDQGGAFYDHEGTLRFEEPEVTDGDRPEIDRTQLRDLLLASLPEGTVRWSSKVRAIEPLAEGRFRVVGEEGSRGDFDLVVGADGARSRVRPLVSSAKAEYSGVAFVEIAIDDVDDRHPEVAALVPRGKVGAAGNGRGLIAQRSSNGHVRAYFMFREPEAWLRALDLSAPEKAAERIKELLPGWSRKWFAFIDAGNRPFVARPIVSLPVGHRWAHRSGVTLIGDAAHVMPPFGGDGVNLAMIDAADLALALAGDADWDRAIAAFEEKMCARAEPSAAGAMQGLGFVGEDAAEHALEHFEAVKNQAASKGAA